MTEGTQPDRLREKLQSMIDGYRISQALYVAAELGIADALQDGPKRADELAAGTRVDPRSLFRVLRALASAGVLRQLDDTRFALSPLGDWLRSGTSGTLRPWALLSGRMYRAWGDFLDSIETGKGGLGSGYGKRRWERLERSPEDARIFHDAMGANSAWLARAVLDAYDFSAFASILDVGGGNGMLIASILAKYQDAQGVIFDLPEAVSETGKRLEGAGLAGRCQLLTGSFFDSVPQGADAYLLSRVLHDWEDDQAARILQRVRRAMTRGTTLLVLERLLGDSPDVEATLSDLGMLLMNGGCERTAAEFDGLLAGAGFRLKRVVPTQTPIHILEAVAV
jgi:O-methyltransferase/methyltransferase family protein